MRIVKADAVTLVLAAETDYNKADPLKPLTRDLERACESALRAARKNYAALRKASIDAHEKLFHRVSLDLGVAPAIPTDERLEAVKAGKSDPALAALYFQVRTLPADELIAAGRIARELAGPLERAHDRAMEQRLPHQY